MKKISQMIAAGHQRARDSMPRTMCAMAGASLIAAWPCGARAQVPQGTYYSVFESNAPEQMQPSGSQYCFLTGFSGLGIDTNRSDFAQVYYGAEPVPSDWYLWAGNSQATASASAECIPYDVLQAPYEHNPHSTYEPNGAQWYYGNAQESTDWTT